MVIRVQRKTLNTQNSTLPLASLNIQHCRRLQLNILALASVSMSRAQNSKMRSLPLRVSMMSKAMTWKW